MRKYLTVPLLFFSMIAIAEDRTDRIFEIGKTSGTPVFTQETHIEDRPDGTRHWISSIKDADGKVVMTEVADIKGLQILSQKVEQLQVGEAYELEIVDGKKDEKKVKFKIFKIDGDKKKELEPDAVEDLPANFVTGPVSEPYLRDHKEELLKGKSIYAKFGIFELQRTVNFEFYKKGKEEKELRIRMEPANFFVSALVDPIDMYFDKNTMKLVRYVGRTPLKKKVGDKWKPFDAEILYP